MAKHKLYGHYRPHARVQELGQVVNRITGEITIPPSRTKQEFLAECDINNIIALYKQTGIMTHISAKAAIGAYENLPDDSDFQSAMNTVIQAQDAFATLPSKVRDRFHNDPTEFLAFCANPENLPEMRTLGLALEPPRAPPPLPSSSSPSPEPTAAPTGESPK